MVNNLVPNDLYKFLQKTAFNFVAFLFIIGILGFILFVAIYSTELYYELDSTKVDPILAKYTPNIKYWIAAVIFLSLVFAIWSYFTPEPANENNNKALIKIKSDYYNEILSKISLSVGKDLQNELDSQNLDEAEEIIRAKIQAFNNITEVFTGQETGVLKGTDINTVASFYESTANRIDSEINRQKSLSWLNLLVGLITTLSALLFLIMNFSKSIQNLTELIPRLSIALLIEVFSFYFLNLYRKNQEEIKFWNNEKTNLDLKLFALGIAADNQEIGDKIFMQGVVLELLKTERNNILKKEDTTVEIEKAKLENLGFESFINKLTQVFDTFSAKK